MQPPSPSPGIVLVTTADNHAALPVVKPQAVACAARPVRAVASFAVGSRRGARCAAFGKRWGRGVSASTPVLEPSPNMAVKRDWPKAASFECFKSAAPSPSRASVAASPLPLR